jgi:hypothetical protein
MFSHLYKCHVTSFVNHVRTKMINGNGSYISKYNCQIFHIVFTVYIVYITLYWIFAISSDVSYL